MLELFLCLKRVFGGEEPVFHETSQLFHYEIRLYVESRNQKKVVISENRMLLEKQIRPFRKAIALYIKAEEIELVAGAGFEPATFGL